ncbi:MAG: dTDP-4-keto-6-deoxy-D-glucose epimerase [Thermoanaerobaculia bacterium]|nr:MAG: dTDP-4-keto-6-deoxy-D-glucose epimerase [Thermoanaerobaculia bacterium]MBZ0102498.1 dTDP-4-dehydrorhamnose 3,5-epimerase family protein [Thermoanaerobaculia bacterium]
MRFEPLAPAGAWRITVEPSVDERGLFARTWCAREFAAAGIPSQFVQTSLSWNPRRGTLRGLHWQAAPHGEGKLVRCTRGRIHDVLVDLRDGSPTRLRPVELELSADGREAVWIPPGVAHGFLTLEDGCEVHYAMTVEHVAEASRGARFDDPAFGIRWPASVEVISQRDRGWPDFEPSRSAC